MTVRAESFNRPSVWYLAGGAFLWAIAMRIFIAPGQIENDIYEQANQATGQTPMSDWHPPIMSALWGALAQLMGTMDVLLSINVLLMATGIWLLCWTILLRTDRPGLACLPLAVLVTPWTLSQLVLLWKDTTMAAALVFGCGAVFLAAECRKRQGRVNVAPIGLMVLAVISIAFAVLVRKNAVAAVVPVVLYAAAVWSPRQAALGRLHMTGSSVARRLRTAAGSAGRFAVRSFAVVAAVGCAGVGMNLWVESTHTIEQTHQIDQIILDDVMFSVPSEELHKSGASPELITRLDTARRHCLDIGWISDAYWRCWGRGLDGEAYQPVEHAGELKQLWKQHVLTHPFRWFDYRLENYSRYLTTTQLVTLREHGRGAEIGMPFTPNPVSETVRGVVLAAEPTAVFKAWFWLALSTLMCLAAIVFRPQFGREIIALSTSALVYMLAYIPVIPAFHFRYTYWPAVAVSLACVLAIAGSAHGNTRGQRRFFIAERKRRRTIR